CQPHDAERVPRRRARRGLLRLAPLLGALQAVDQARPRLARLGRRIGLAVTQPPAFQRLDLAQRADDARLPAIAKVRHALPEKERAFAVVAVNDRLLASESRQDL